MQQISWLRGASPKLLFHGLNLFAFAPVVPADMLHSRS
jgi:hypothetical protein